MVSDDEFDERMERMFHDIFGIHNEPPPDLWPKVKARLSLHARRTMAQQAAVAAARQRLGRS